MMTLAYFICWLLSTAAAAAGMAFAFQQQQPRRSHALYRRIGIGSKELFLSSQASEISSVFGGQVQRGMSTPSLVLSSSSSSLLVECRRRLLQLSLSAHSTNGDKTGIEEGEEEEDDETLLEDAIDRAPCFDNGVCLSFPDEEEEEHGMDNTSKTTQDVVSIQASDSNHVYNENNDDNDVVTTIISKHNHNAINSNNHPTPQNEVVDTNTGSDDGRDGGDGGGGAIQRLGGTTTGPTVWSEFGRLAAEYSHNNKLFSNLGQGFPDWSPPEFAVQSLVSAALDTTTSSSSSSSSSHQYTRTAGHPNLVKQLAKRYSKHLDRHVDPMAEVAVTVGASQALYLCLQTLVRPGEEVVLFEPFFDLYVNQIKLAGGIPVYVPLTFVPYNTIGGSSSSSCHQEHEGGGDDCSDSARRNLAGSVGGGRWILESNKLRDKISSAKTRAIILNSPHNPTGKVFTHSEMLDIAQIVTEVAGPQCVVLSDEVYKYIVHSPPRDADTLGNHDSQAVGNSPQLGSSSSSISNTRITSSCPGHVHFASLPNMWERTLTISSAGKTFSATGWQVGWCIGPPHLISPIHQLLPYVQFCASTVIQEALARTLPRADEAYEGYASYYEYLNEKYRRKRDLLSKALKDVGFAVPDYDATPGWGGFFIFAQITPEVRRALPSHRLQMPHCANSAAPGGRARLDWALCQWMVEELGVLCIPSSPFFSKERALDGASDEFIRVAFCKTDETIERAALALRKLALFAGENKDTTDALLEEDVMVAAVGGLS